MTIDMQDANSLTGAAVLGNQDDKLGKISDVYFDNETNKPEWASVKTGMSAGTCR